MSAIGACSDVGGGVVVALGFVASVCVSVLCGANDRLLLSVPTGELLLLFFLRLFWYGTLWYGMVPHGNDSVRWVASLYTTTLSVHVNTVWIFL